MKRRYSIYLGLIALLVAINLARLWLYSGKVREDTVVHGKVFLPEDFRLRVDLPAAGEPHRNLFQPMSVTTRAATAHAGQARVKAMKPSPIKPVQNEAEPTVDKLGKLRLLGVVFRAGKGQAYLALDKETVIAFAGNTVFGQFVVARVTVDAVELRDLKTNTIRKIPVSGKR